ncbi:MAG: acyltransferase [Solirubrobacterales bacterium]|nr:acyltransferase [Solirubrobacterales bacterium]
MFVDPGQEDRQKRGLPIVPVFDGYRAFAIFGIIIYHLLGVAPFNEPWMDEWVKFQTATFGQLIDVLFIVSGFVVFLPTAARGNFGSLGGYAIRRAARLLPAYYLILILTMLVLAFAPTEFERSFPTLPAIGIHLLDMQTLTSYSDNLGAIGFGVVGPVWTLSVEVGFYLVLPLVAMWFYRHPRAGLVAGALIAVAWAQLGIHAESVADFLGLGMTGTTAHRIDLATGIQFPFWAFSFALGMAGAKLYVEVRKRWEEGDCRRRAAWAQLAGLAGLVLFTILIYSSPENSRGIAVVAEGVRHSPLIMLGYSASLATLMVATALGPDWTRRPFDNRPMKWLAEVSYGAYLSHALFLFIGTYSIGATFQGNVQTLLAWSAAILPATILYGYLSARYLEQPIRRWARKFGRNVT